MIKKSLLFLFLIGLILFAGCSGGGTTIPNTVSVSGRIVNLNEDGEVIQSSTLARTFHIRGTDLVTISGEDGIFLLHNVPTGEQKLDMIFHGYETVTRNLNLQETTDVGDIEIINYFEPIGMRLLYINNERIELELRKAISLAIDKDEILQIFENTESAASPNQNITREKANQFITAVAVGYDPDIDHTYDVEEAKRVVEEQEFEGRTIELVVMSNETELQIMDYLVIQLQSVGLNAVKQQLDYASFRKKVLEEKDYGLFIMGPAAASSKSPLPMLGYWSDAGSNSIRMDSDLREELERICAKAKLQYDRQEFEASVNEFQQLALANYISIPLIQTYSNDAL